MRSAKSPGNSADLKTDRTADETVSVESISRELTDLFGAWRKSALLEACIPIVVGVVVIPIIYMVLAFLVVTGIRIVTYRKLETASIFSAAPLLVFGAWFLLGAIIAWRHVQPFEKRRPPPGKAHDPHVDPPLVRFDRGDLEFSDPSSILHLDSVLALFASGPRNILEGIAALRDLPRVKEEDFRRAAELLVRATSNDGLTERGFQRDDVTARAMTILWSLKLIRRDGTFVKSWRIRATELGSEVARV